MKQTPLILFAAILLLTACDPDDGPLQPTLRTLQICEAGLGEFDVFLEPQISAIGPVGNELAASDDAIWVVESGSNSVSRFDRDSQQLDPFFVDVGNERNPYAAALDEEADELWIVNYATNTISIADLKSGEIIEEIQDDSLKNPSAIVLTDTHAYVGNINFISLLEGYGPGSITLIDRASNEVVEALETDFKNPHFISIETIDGAPILLVSSGGAFERTDNAVEVVSEGGLEIFAIDQDPSNPPHQSFALGQLDARTVGAPGQALLTPDGESLYFASGNAPVLFVFDLIAREWTHDASSPLQLYETEDDATHKAVIDSQGLLWITSFNEDSLYLFDTNCDAKVAPPIDLGRVANMLEGPQAILVVEQGSAKEAYILLTIANALGRVRLVPVSE